ncbi:hypothetical protein E3N88_44206 [Mikania micrantha]|uniref:Uncharacterized protein n=1 Tax=Mikania micrantha TaxID=192012 RepID=A0A5N6LCR4_9ASTR|nr:hypothetical protein E3N88_44272 [Mikania micrantha]KAD0475169.1 hypothetical protein E3N88_44206 [Mikania micrantha]
MRGEGQLALRFFFFPMLFRTCKLSKSDIRNGPTSSLHAKIVYHVFYRYLQRFSRSEDSAGISAREKDKRLFLIPQRTLDPKRIGLIRTDSIMIPPSVAISIENGGASATLFLACLGHIDLTCSWAREKEACHIGNLLAFGVVSLSFALPSDIKVEPFLSYGAEAEEKKRSFFGIFRFVLSVGPLDRFSSFFMEFPQDLRSILLSLVFSSGLYLFRWRSDVRVYYGYPFLWLFFFFLFLIAGGIFHPVIAWCDAGNASPPLSPPGGGPPPQPDTPPIPDPVPVVIPQLAQPLLSDEDRRNVLYHRYLLLNLGGSDDLRRMVSTIHAQLIVERYVEAALVEDGFHPPEIVSQYRDIRGSLHSPQGRLLGVRTYESYVTQIRGHGTRESVPYRRLLRAIHHYDILLSRRNRES